MNQLSIDFRTLRTKAFDQDSQCFQILSYLKSGKTLTKLEAAQKGWGLSLNSRVAELREAGWEIHCRTVKKNGRTVYEYSL